LTKLDCGHCYKLSDIPELPKLTALDCRYCEALTGIPLLPNLTNLVYYNCPNLSISTIPIKFIPDLDIDTLIKCLEYNPYNICDMSGKPELLNLPSTLNIISEYLEYVDGVTLLELEGLLTENNIPLPTLVKPANKV
jgi:hypothetical protein